MQYMPLIAVMLALGLGKFAIKADGGTMPEATPTVHATERWVDLTHDFEPGIVHWPTSEGFELEVISDGINHRGWYHRKNRISLPEHTGTHVDAPIHFSQNGRTAEQIPLDDLIGPGIVIDVSAKAEADRNYQITVADIRAWEMRYGEISGRPIVLFNTGSSSAWTSARAYLGTGRRGERGAADLHFPGLHPSAAKFLVEERNIRAVGLDTPSIDFGQTMNYMTHRIICGAGIPIFENVANLDQVPPAGAEIIALPMKIKGGSGGPLRIIAKVGA